MPSRMDVPGQMWTYEEGEEIQEKARIGSYLREVIIIDWVGKLEGHQTRPAAHFQFQM